MLKFRPPHPGTPKRRLTSSLRLAIPLPRRGEGITSFLALLLTLLTVSPTIAETRPQRIVSMNLCTDQLVMMLADREQITSLSYAAADPNQSLVADEVGDIPLNYGHAEEIVPLKPDLVLSGSFTTPFTDRLLRAQNIPVVEIKLEQNLQDVRDNMHRIAKAVGHPKRGEQMVSSFIAKIDKLRRIPKAPRMKAMVLIAGGFTPGRKSIAHDLMHLAGLQNVTALSGVETWSNLSLESFLQAAPDIIIFGNEPGAARSQSSALLTHPALQTFMDKRIHITVPSKLFGCGTPHLTHALEQITEAIP